MKFTFVLVSLLLASCAGQQSPEVLVNIDENVMSLAGSEWSLDSDDAATKDVFIQFGGDGTVSGSGGCNRIGGQFEQSGTSIKIGPLFTTKKACAAPIMDVERRILNALETARELGVSHFELKLMDEDGAALLKLIRSDWD